MLQFLIPVFMFFAVIGAWATGYMVGIAWVAGGWP